MIDLHVHSTCSDGTLSPKELVDYAMSKGLRAFALTDHDSVNGIDIALSYCDELIKSGINNVPEVIPAIELSSEYNGVEVHVVGLYIDHKNKEFLNYLTDFLISREDRNIRLCQKMSENGFNISYREMKATYPKRVLTRAHFADMLCKKGYVKSKNEAFERYIGDHCPFYIPREKITPYDAIKLIKDAGGTAVLAHPVLYRLSSRNLRNLVIELKEAGLDGIEAFYSTYKPSEEREILGLANELHLLLSGGSDFHGSNKDNIDLGTGMGKLYVHDSVLDAIKLSRKNLLFTDMDGTLLNNSSEISPNMKDALKRLVQNGHRIVYNSGRPLPSMINHLHNLGIDFEGSVYAAFGGGIIYDLSKKKVLFSEKISGDTVKKLYEIAKENGVHSQGFTETSIIVDSLDKELEFYRKRINIPYKEVGCIPDYLNEGSVKFQFISLDNYDLLKKLRKIVDDTLGDYVDTVFSNTLFLEILPKGINKGIALKKISDYFFVPKENTYACGDAENDIDMLNAAGTAIAVSNASPEAKKAADIITKNDNDHDGLIEIIDKFFI